MTIEQSARRLRAREISAVELARESLKTIHAEQPRLNAFITITEETALEQARRADEDFAKGIDRGPLQGIPYALKDLFDTAGIRTTGGTKIFADRVPAAAGMVAFALGSDTGGSIRIPAAYCGCTGHKPTYGIVSRYGCMALGNNLDHMGPLTVTPRDAALVMDAIAGYDSRDDSSIATPAGDFWRDSFSLRGVRAGIPENFFTERLAPEVAAAFQAALDRAKSAGAELKPIRVPDPEALNVIGRVILMSEVSALMEPYAHRRDEFGPDVIALIDQGRMLPATDYINAQRLRRRWQREWAKVWKDIDILLTPTAPIVAPKIGQATVFLGEQEEDARLASTRFVRSINVLGLPALSVPLPVSGLPIGLQIIGPPFADNLILSAGGCLA